MSAATDRAPPTRAPGSGKERAYRAVRAKKRSPRGPPARARCPHLSWNVRSARYRTIRTFQIKVRSKFFQNRGDFAGIHQKSKTFRNVQHVLQIFGEIPRNFPQNLSKIQWKWSIFVKFCRKMRNSLTKKFWNIEVWAVQKHVNLVDLVKSFPTNIFLQNLASIQKRPSPLKFDHLAEKSE